MTTITTRTKMRTLLSVRDEHGYELWELMGNEILDLAGTSEAGSAEAAEIVRRALAGNRAALEVLAPYTPD